MRAWDAERIAQAAEATLVWEPSAAPGEPGPRGVSIDSRDVKPGDLFIGLRGSRADGGAHAASALAAGAWGGLLAPEHAQRLAESAPAGTVLAHPEPLHGLQALARAWRRELAARGTKVVAITGSTGKTSTKDILAALLGAHVRTVASPENLNTEIGLPIALLRAPADTQALVLEMAMRGEGQIGELTAIAEPDVGVIVNVGPAHLELLGSIEAIAAAKAELIDGLPSGATIVIPTDEPVLEPHLRGDLHTVRFGDGGDVALEEVAPDGAVAIRLGTERVTLQPSFRGAHHLLNLLAAVAAAQALGVRHEGALQVRFSALRGERRTLPGGVLLIDDCYNANPMSMRAAIDDLAETDASRRVAVLGDMLELGEDAPRFHREIGAHAAARGLELLVTVGPLAGLMREGFQMEAHSVDDAAAAAELLGGLLRPGDAVLVKGSRGVGLELVAETLGSAGDGAPRQDAGGTVGEGSAAGEGPVVGDGPAVLAPGGRPGRR
ncbi:MAG TPA: UDP-N-acetylmuramoyl-tripeptide--D-alanyl-D-alanine ligase [Solirubrobacteraceae bacterium]|jgi:UDP-N-acetylmuramoyl-tripeptide--D-alanyl-D-alanine ligase|nr:UDP-N-acetylmuramoyl-tripeptide--D-alanyl-D-alanine ligase [Solirubrobacteraceae bacterium]